MVLKQLIMKTLIVFFVLSINYFSIAQTLNESVLVLKNLDSPISIAVANDYMLRRNVNKVLELNCYDNGTDSTYDYIDFSYYVTAIENPIKNYLSTHPEIDFIVFTKGFPIHLYNTPNKPYGGNCCIDSRISALGYQSDTSASLVNISDIDYGNTFVGQAYANKFWDSSVRFSHATFGGYMVTRLDGFTQADAIALTTRSLQAEANLANATPNSGVILLDACATFGFPAGPQPYSIIPNNYVAGQQINITTEGPYGLYNVDMQEAAADLTANSIPVQFENTANFITSASNLNGYVSWGSNDSNYTFSTYNSHTFVPGAIAETAVSTGARTFLPVNVGQSLIANLISQGVTGVKGYTDEPLLVAVASPKILFNRYRQGWTLAESFYAASRLVNWMDVVIGDPICIAYANNLAVKTNYFNSKISIFPNPSTNFISISGLEKSAISVVDVLGKTVLSIPEYASSSKIDVSKLQSGIYFVKIENTYQNLKFIKK